MLQQKDYGNIIGGAWKQRGSLKENGNKKRGI